MDERDVRIHGAYGDSVIQRRPISAGDSKVKNTLRYNVQLYLERINVPQVAERIRSKGCSGWPCQTGFICDFCLLRLDTTSSIEPLEQEIHDLKQTVALLRKQQADVETLERAERLMAGSYWSAAEEKRLFSISSMIEESKSRLEAVESERGRVAAENVRDSLMTQITSLQDAYKQKELELTLCQQRVEALNEIVQATKVESVIVTKELNEKRSIIADAIKEKGRAAREVTRLSSLVQAQDIELAVKAEQLKDTLCAIQKLQGVQSERDRYQDLAAQRAHLAQGIMNQVGEDLIMAERIRDENSQTVRKLEKENAIVKKAMVDQQNVIAKLRAKLAEHSTKKFKEKRQQAAAESTPPSFATKAKARETDTSVSNQAPLPLTAHPNSYRTGMTSGGNDKQALRSRPNA